MIIIIIIIFMIPIGLVLHSISGLIMSASLDGLIRIINLEQFSLVREIDIQKPILSFRTIFYQNTLSCLFFLSDSTVKLWKINANFKLITSASGSVNMYSCFKRLNEKKVNFGVILNDLKIVENIPNNNNTTTTTTTTTNNKDSESPGNDTIPEKSSRITDGKSVKSNKNTTNTSMKDQMTSHTLNELNEDNDNFSMSNKDSNSSKSSSSTGSSNSSSGSDTGSSTSSESTGSSSTGSSRSSSNSQLSITDDGNGGTSQQSNSNNNDDENANNDEENVDETESQKAAKLNDHMNVTNTNTIINEEEVVIDTTQTDILNATKASYYQPETLASQLAETPSLLVTVCDQECQIYTEKGHVLNILESTIETPVEDIIGKF